MKIEDKLLDDYAKEFIDENVMNNEGITFERFVIEKTRGER